MNDKFTPFTKYYNSLNAIQITAHVFLVIAIVLSSLAHPAFFFIWAALLTFISIIVVSASLIFYMDK